MLYLGGISGRGRLICDGEELGEGAYDFDGFFERSSGVVGSGEIRLKSSILESVFGRPGVQLLTRDGHLLNLKFSDKVLIPASTSAHVDVTGDLPKQSQWRH